MQIAFPYWLCYNLSTTYQQIEIDGGKKMQKFPLKQIEQVVSVVDELFAEHILGMYLYGSYVVGGLKINSDIDILVILDEEISHTVREELTKELLLISGEIGCKEKRCLEVTIVNCNDIISQDFPLKCEYMYGEWLREDIKAGKIPQAYFEADLTILLWQARKYNILLTGKKALDLIPSISNEKVKGAIHTMIPSLLEGVHGDERNTLLTLARMWYTLETYGICAKNIAAEWTLPKLPKDLKSLMILAIKGYLGECTDNWTDKKKELMKLIDFLKIKVENY